MDGATDIFLQQNAAFYVPIAHCPPAAIKQGRATIASRIEVRRMGGSTLNNSIISKSAEFSPMMQPRIEFTAKLVISLYLSPTCREMRYRVIFSRGRHLGGTHRGRASNYRPAPNFYKVPQFQQRHRIGRRGPVPLLQSHSRNLSPLLVGPSQVLLLLHARTDATGSFSGVSVAAAAKFIQVCAMLSPSPLLSLDDRDDRLRPTK